MELGTQGFLAPRELFPGGAYLTLTQKNCGGYNRAALIYRAALISGRADFPMYLESIKFFSADVFEMTPGFVGTHPWH